MSAVQAVERRSRRFYWRNHAAVALGVAVAGAALTGALMVGDSMRGSLREVALQRLGGVQAVLQAPRFFDASRLALDTTEIKTAPVIVTIAGVHHADSGARAERVQVLGIDDRFWQLEQPFTTDPRPTGVAVNATLAHELGLTVGDDVVIRLERPQTISPETLLGHRDETVITQRWAVGAILPTTGLGAFTLEHGHAPTMNLFVPLRRLQRALDRRDAVNAILAGGARTATLDDAVADLQDRLAASITQPGPDGTSAIALLDLRLASVPGPPDQPIVSLESGAFLLPPPAERAAQAVADRNADILGPAGRVLGYLANSLTAGSRAVPYSVVVAVDDPALAQAQMARQPADATDRGSVTHIDPGTIVLNAWTADDLGVQRGDTVEMTYYLTGPFGELETHGTSFEVADILAMAAVATAAAWTPRYPGVSDSPDIADWDPPFPVDLQKIRDADEDYWDRYGTAPKAFVSLGDGQRMWAHDAERFGQFTAVRWQPPVSNRPGAVPEIDLPKTVRSALQQHLDPAEFGLQFANVRDQALQAATGSTDFGGLFIGFSFFVIAAAGLLVVLLFRLTIERRAREVGLLLAIGHDPQHIRRRLIKEGLVTAIIGSVLGLAGAIGYAALMLTGLRTWWADAVQAPFLRLHVTPLTLIIGLVATTALAWIAMRWALRGLTDQAPRVLLAGTILPASPPSQRRRWLRLRRLALPATVVGALGLVVLSLVDVVPSAPAFFGSGAALLVAGLLGIRRRLQQRSTRTLTRPGWHAVVGLAARNVPRHPGRSLATMALMASATFLICALGAFRVEPAADDRRDGGTGGYALVGEATLPLLHSPDSPAGRNALALPAPTAFTWDDVTITPLRLRPGDAASCRNLYVPTRHRVAGATPAFIERGGFAFHGTLEPTATPWTLLDHTFEDGAIPVIGDESAVRWQLHSGLGQDLTIHDDHGRPVVARFVALLKGSALQDELIVAEHHFERLFPQRSGYGLFLIDTGGQDPDAVGTWLERELGTRGFDVTSTTDRLAAYLAVQNTYLSTFETLGGLGLLLGTLGLAAVLLRNIWERRRELAVMQACGFRRTTIGGVVLAENLLLVVVGMLAGLIPAAIAIAPQLLRDGRQLPWIGLGSTLGAILLVGATSGIAALWPLLRMRLIPALRSE